MLNKLFNLLFGDITSRYELSEDQVSSWKPEWSNFLQHNVTFYRVLDNKSRRLFERRIMLFWQTTEIEGSYGVEVTDEDLLLVAASAVIPVWGFSGWHYFNLSKVILLPAAFNNEFECGQPDSLYTGMVGTGPMSGKMALSKPALHYGFTNARDKMNVGIHEFVHLVDLADGDCDGFPERLKDYAFAIPWFEFVNQKIEQINQRKSNIREYGVTNRAEFFAVVSEYFFERPKMLEQKHPQLYRVLQELYHQDVRAIGEDIQPRKNAPCPCGSGKKYKRCCMPGN